MNWSAWAVETSRTDGSAVQLLVSATPSADAKRTPVLVNIALDRSGSMKGAPLSAALEATLQFVDVAQADDYLGLVLFDGVAEQRVPVCAMDAAGKQAMRDALQGVQTGRGTALHGALELAAKGLQRLLVPGRQPRVLVLTDGEPSVGPDVQSEFETLAEQLKKQNIAVHALGLARHYVAEVLESITRPSSNAFEHVDGPEGLSEVLGAVMARLFGQVATGTELRVRPSGFASLQTRHAYPARLDGDSLVIQLGDVSRGVARRALFAGSASKAPWALEVQSRWQAEGVEKIQTIDVQRVEATSSAGRLVVSLGFELDMVSAESAAWLSLARRELDRAEAQLETAEGALRELVTLSPDELPVKRHVERVSDLRLAIERGEGDIPLLIRRARSARAGTAVSQVIALEDYRSRR